MVSRAAILLLIPLSALIHAGRVEPSSTVPASCRATQIDPPPKTLVCGGQGTVVKPSYLQNYTPVSGQSECLDRCRSNTKCIAFGVKTSTTQNNCALFTKPIKGQTFRKNKTSSNYFWNKNCFGDSCSCTPNSDNPDLCGKNCVNFDHDEKNCGSCGTTCASNVCRQSMCVGICAAQGKTECSGQCVDTTSDDEHCGSCDNSCTTNGQVCVQSQCVCPENTADCNDSGTCSTNLLNNDQHCGSCLNACPENSSCNGTTCQCDAPYTMCGNVCVNTMTDSANCNGCGTTCPSDYPTCDNGMCKYCIDGCS